ncbi:hypothetical protein D3C85_1023650 [compost metagenome]
MLVIEGNRLRNDLRLRLDAPGIREPDRVTALKGQAESAAIQIEGDTALGSGMTVQARAHRHSIQISTILLDHGQIGTQAVAIKLEAA